MTIHLPQELAFAIEAIVHSGQFASDDEAMAEAARLLLRNLTQASLVAVGDDAPPVDPELGSIGAMKDDADLLSEIVTDAYKRRMHKGSEGN